jgi:hypothetical protein
MVSPIVYSLSPLPPSLTNSLILYTYSLYKIRIYKEYHSVCPLVGIGTLPTPLSPARLPLPPRTGGVGVTLDRLRVRGWGSPNSDDWRKSLAICLLCVCRGLKIPPKYFFNISKYSPIAQPSLLPNPGWNLDCFYNFISSLNVLIKYSFISTQNTGGSLRAERFFKNIFLGDFFSYYIQHCFIYRPSDSTVPTDAGIEPRTVATGALAAYLLSNK